MITPLGSPTVRSVTSSTAFNQGLVDELNSLVSEDVHFTVRTDTGKTKFEVS